MKFILIFFLVLTNLYSNSTEYVDKSNHVNGYKPVLNIEYNSLLETTLSTGFAVGTISTTNDDKFVGFAFETGTNFKDAAFIDVSAMYQFNGWFTITTGPSYIFKLNTFDDNDVKIKSNYYGGQISIIPTFIKVKIGGYYEDYKKEFVGLVSAGISFQSY